MVAENNLSVIRLEIPGRFRDRKGTDSMTEIKKSIKIGLAGLGTVGSGVATILKNSNLDIIKKTGVSIELVAMLDLNFQGKEHLIPEQCLTTSNLDTFLATEMDVVVEVIGGTKFAKEVIEKALSSGRHVVTANKALLALHGKEIFQAIAEKNLQFKFEAAVCGAIPIIQTIEKALPQNSITKIDGILNGTSNYILTRMHEENLGYHEVLPEAQRLGFAEADPTFDVDGLDAAHKLAILANLAFGSYIPFSDVYVRGIRSVHSMDVKMADRMGYVIKPLGITKMKEGRIEARVHPTMIPKTHPLASVRLENNGVFYESNYSGPGSLFGKGAGSLPTGSAIIGDILQIARNSSVQNCFAVEKQFAIATLEQITSRFYIRLMTIDRPGILSRISGILGDHEISIASVMQLESGAPLVPLTMMTHQAIEKNVHLALEKIQSLSEVQEEIVLIHVES